MLKPIKYIVRRIIRPDGKVEEVYDIVGKKASIIKLCQEGKLHPRKCRKYGWYR